MKSLIDRVPSKLQAIALRALPTKPSLLSSLRIIHPLLIWKNALVPPALDKANIFHKI